MFALDGAAASGVTGCVVARLQPPMVSNKASAMAGDDSLISFSRNDNAANQAIRIECLGLWNVAGMLRLSVARNLARDLRARIMMDSVESRKTTSLVRMIFPVTIRRPRLHSVAMLRSP